MKTGRGRTARRFNLRAKPKPSSPHLSGETLSDVLLAVRMIRDAKLSGRRTEDILMELAQEITPSPGRLAAIRASLPPSSIDYEEEEEHPY